MYLFLGLFFSLSSFAQFNLNKISVEDFNLDYTAPKGIGRVKKIVLGTGMSKNLEGYPFEINRQEGAIFFQSPVLDLTLENPPVFIDNVEKASAYKLNAVLNKQQHTLKAYSLMFKPKDDSEYKFDGVNLNCLGNSAKKELLPRVMDDCREKMQASVTKMYGPIMRYILDILSRPEEGILKEDLPNDLEVSIDKGQLFLNLAVRYIITARARAWGEVFYENDYQTIAVRIDQIKYGVVPVTGVVLKQLQARVKHPRVKVTPPWIRIDISAK